jgi:hypothetical protein
LGWREGERLTNRRGGRRVATRGGKGGQGKGIFVIPLQTELFFKFFFAFAEFREK